MTYYPSQSLMAADPFSNFDEVVRAGGHLRLRQVFLIHALLQAKPDKLSGFEFSVC